MLSKRILTFLKLRLYFGQDFVVCLRCLIKLIDIELLDLRDRLKSAVYQINTSSLFNCNLLRITGVSIIMYRKYMKKMLNARKFS